MFPSFLAAKNLPPHYFWLSMAAMSDSLVCKEVMRIPSAQLSFSDMLEPALQFQSGSCKSTHFSFMDDNSSGSVAPEASPKRSSLSVSYKVFPSSNSKLMAISTSNSQSSQHSRSSQTYALLAWKVMNRGIGIVSRRETQSQGNSQLKDSKFHYWELNDSLARTLCKMM